MNLETCPECDNLLKYIRNNQYRRNVITSPVFNIRFCNGLCMDSYHRNHNISLCYVCNQYYDNTNRPLRSSGFIVVDTCSDVCQTTFDLRPTENTR